MLTPKQDARLKELIKHMSKSLDSLACMLEAGTEDPTISYPSLLSSFLAISQELEMLEAITSEQFTQKK